MPRLAAIDLGSNTVRLLVADADARTGLRMVHGEQTIARLGEGLARHGTLQPTAMDRTLTVLRGQVDQASVLGAERVMAVATAAVRQAGNRTPFVRRVHDELGLAIRVVEGEEEARLMLLGVLWGLPALPGPLGVLDVGGGSTELVVARGTTPLGVVSVGLGVVALAERFFHADPVDHAEYEACARHADERLEREMWPAIRPLGVRALAGTAGTVTTLAALDIGLRSYDAARVQGHRLSREGIRALAERLGALPLAERRRVPCLEPGRADLIVPGIAVVLAVLDGLRLDGLIVSDTGLREGILLDAVGWAPT